MTQLLINDSKNAQRTAFGGLPVAPNGVSITWPVCKSCKGNMQYLGRIHVAANAQRKDRLILLFMCQNDPGLCDEWQPDGGGNKAIVVGTEQLTEMAVPAPGVTQLDTTYGAEIVTVKETDYDDARTQWAQTSGKSPRQILGQLGGTPAWIQADETPTCDACGKQMSFVAQLEQGPDYKTEMNFGGGCAYVFECDCDSAAAKMLWQC